jgi:hypothetical protein
MKSLWPEEFTEKEVKPAKEILEEQALLLPKLTGDMVKAGVRQWRDVEKLLTNHQRDFAFSFLIKGKFLKNYSFKVFDFSHEITLYPTTVEFDEQLSNELGMAVDIEIETEDQFIELLSKIFASERIKDIIGSIIKLSAAK